MTHRERIAKMLYTTVYPLYVNKVLKKNRTELELIEVIQWLTGYSEKDLLAFTQTPITFEVFFEKAKLNKNAHLITGSICGYKVQEIEDPLIQKVRMLDKLVDELAKGKALEKIKRG